MGNAGVGQYFLSRSVRVRTWIVVALLAVFAAVPAQAAGKVALVMANAGYRNVPQLPNPPADAALVARSLRAAGFDRVDIAQNLDKSGMEAALRAFGARAEGAEVAMIYYAGHGIEVGGRNFLIPVDARLLRDRDAELDAVSLDTVLAVTEGASMRVILLDACRENPFANNMQRAGAGRSVGRGLGRVEPANDTLVVYAAKAGAIAADGDGGNSPFAAALAKRIVEPGIEINFVFRRVRDDVLAATGRRQEPFIYGSLSGSEIYLVIGTTTNSRQPLVNTADAAQFELASWQGALKADSEEGYSDYLQRYPQGSYANMARANLARIRRGAQPAAPATPIAQVTGAARWGLTDFELQNLGASDLLKKAGFPARTSEVRSAAEAGDGAAAHLLGIAYGFGLQGMPDDPVQAIRWYKQSANAGYGAAMASLGWYYDTGKGVTQDFAQAAQWYQRAADINDQWGLYGIGSLYRQGKGVPQDYAKAMQFYRRAAELNNNSAIADIGYMYEYGLGVTANRQLAIDWYKRAATLGNSWAKDNLKRLGVSS